jgi:hypothetical protein
MYRKNIGCTRRNGVVSRKGEAPLFYEGPSMRPEGKEDLMSVNDMEGSRRLDEVSFSVDDMLGSGFSIKAKKGKKSARKSPKKAKKAKKSVRKSKKTSRRRC